MFTLFAIPDSATTISATSAVVTPWLEQYLPVVSFVLAITVVVMTIRFLSRKLSGGAKGVLGGRRRRRGR